MDDYKPFQTSPRRALEIKMEEHVNDKPCKHMTGYWINKDAGSFRCTDRCGYQFNVIDVKQDDRRKISSLTAGRSR